MKIVKKEKKLNKIKYLIMKNMNNEKKNNNRQRKNEQFIKPKNKNDEEPDNDIICRIKNS